MKFSAFFLLLALVLGGMAQEPPITPEQLQTLVRSIKVLGEDQIIGMVERRGVDFWLSGSMRQSLKKAGATDGLLAAVAKASAERRQRILKPETQPAVTAEPEPALPPPLDAEAKVHLFAAARTRALEYSKGLPSFICLQVTKRHVDPSGRGDWQMLDTINARLAYDQQKEHYQVVTVNNQLTDKSYEDLGGATSTGEFGSLLLSLFEPETEARFEWQRQAILRHRPVEVLSYTVTQEKSRWHITFNKTLNLIPAYRGWVWLDRETGQTLRLTMAAVDIPPDFPIRVAETTLDYDYATISGLRFLLPSHANVLMSEGRVVTRNEIEFRLYRKFTAESAISFDTEETPPPPPKKPPK